MFTVITAAATTGITTLANLKADLGIANSDTSEDAYLTRAIKQMTSRVCAYMNVPSANDGTRTLGWEELEETFARSAWLRSSGCSIHLARKPVTEIVSVKVGATTIAAADYEFDGPEALLSRVYSGALTDLTYQAGDRTVVRYKAGWKLPGDANPTMPEEIEACVIGIIKATRAARTRDPLVKSQWVTDIERLDFWVGSVSGGNGDTSGLPPELTGMLDPYSYEPM